MNPQIHIRLKILPISPLMNTPVIPGLGIHPKSTSYFEKKLFYKTFLKNITLVSKIVVKIMPEAYGVTYDAGHTRGDR